MMISCVIMGVSGSGKSSIGAAFAARIGAEFVDGDDLHLAANIAKMAAGIPLTDGDRGPWLAAVGQTFLDRDQPLIVACSALKSSYRTIIRSHARRQVIFLHLEGSRDVIAARMGAREGHFMPTELLDSQFAALEAFDVDERAVRVDIDQTPDEILAELVAHFEKDRL